jgi:hypothetical protein
MPNSNHWNAFLRVHKCGKKTIQHLSFIWKNKQSNLVTLHIDYVHQLHSQIATLKQTCCELELKNNYLEYTLVYYEQYDF